jgi:hypothetical protein
MSCINPNSKEFQDILKYEPNFLLAELEYNKLYPSEVDIDTNINTEIDQLKEEQYVPNPNNNYLSDDVVVDELNTDWEYDITNERNSYIPNDLLYDLMNNPANMIMTQENKDKFKVLESIVGKKEAFRDYMEQGQVVRPPSIVVDKINNRISEEVIKENIAEPFITIEEEDDTIDDYALIIEAINQENNIIAIDAISRLSAQLNVPFEIVTQEQANKQFPNKPLPKGYFYGGKVYLVEGMYNQNTVFHEFSHAIIKSLSKDNPELFIQLYNSLKNTSTGYDIIEKIKKAYPELNVDSIPFMEEVIVTSLEFANIENANDQKSFFGKLYLAIKQFLRKVFGKKINISKLNPTTNLSELLDMINQGQEFILNTEFLNSDDLIYFAKMYDDEVAELNKIEKEKSQIILDNIFDTIRKQVSAFKNESDIYVKISDELADVNNTGVLQTMLKLLNEAVTNSKKVIDPLQKLTVQEDIDDRLRVLVKSLVMASEIIPIFNKKLESLKQSGIKSDDDFDKLYAISKYLDTWKTLFDPTIQNQYESAKDLTSYNQLLKNAPKVKDLFTTIHTDLTDALDKANDLRFNALFDVLKNHIEKQFTPIKKESLDRLQKLKNANLIDEYNREYTRYYGVSPIEEVELKQLNANLSNLNVLQVERLKELTRKSYSGLNVTKDQLAEIARNVIGDSGWINGTIETYDNEQDLIVGGFTNYIKKYFNDIDGNINSQLTKLNKNLPQLLDKAGIPDFLANSNTLGEKIRQVNRTTKKEDGKLVEFTENQFISNFINFEYDLNILEENCSKALAEINLNKSQSNIDAYDKALEELDEFKNNYMNRDFVPEYYNLQKKYFNLTSIEETRLNDLINKGINNLVVDLQNNINEVLEFDQLTAKKIAKEKQEEIFKKIRAKDDYLVTSVDDFSASQEIIELWKEYQELAYLYDEFGDEKTGIDLEIAKLLSEFRKESADYYEWVERPNVFNDQFEQFQQKTLQLYPLNSPQYTATINKWLLYNTSVSITDDYYDNRNKLSEERQLILETLAQNNIQIGDVGPLYKKIYAILKKSKDTSGIFDGNSLNIFEQEEIKKLHEKIELIKLDYIQLSGITKRDAKRYKDIYDYYNYYNTIKDEDKQFYKDTTQALRDKLIFYGISDANIQRVKDIDKELGDLTDTSSTKYYLSNFQNLIESNKDTKDVFYNYVLNQFGINLKTDVLPEDKILKLLENTDFIDNLLGLGNTKFERWFINNHYKKDKLVEDGANGWVEITVYAKTAAWQYSIPADKAKFYNSKTANTTNYKGPIEVDGILRVPNNTFFTRQVKNEYRTQPIARDYIDANGKLVLANMDNRGRWLPKTLAEGAKDSKYINNEYVNMFNNQKDLFNLMLHLKNTYLDYQNGLGAPQKMYLSFPRQLFNQNERLQKGYWRGAYYRFFELFKTSVVDEFNNDAANENYQQSSVYVNIHRPISGSYYFEHDKCSLDIIGLMQTHMRSVEHYKMYAKKNSFARMFQKQVEELNNQTAFAAKEVKAKLTFLDVVSKKLKPNQSERLNSINKFIDRYFDGRNVRAHEIGKVTTTSALTKAYNFLASRQAWKSFAFSPIKSLTNFFQGQYAIWTKAFGFVAYTPKNLASTITQCARIQYKLGVEQFSKGEIDKDVQLVLLLDTFSGFFNKELKDFKNTNAGKLLSDPLALGFLDRKILNNSVELHQMLAILDHAKFKFNGNMVTIFDVIELVDGRIQTKKGIPKEYSITYDIVDDKLVLGDMLSNIKNLHQALLQKNIGIGGEMNTPEMYRTLLGKLTFSMIKYFPGMGADKYQFKYNRYTKQVTGRINWGTRSVELGTYISIFALIGQTYRLNGKVNYLQKKHLTNTLEFGIAILLANLTGMLASSIIFNDDDDDKDKPEQEKLNQNSITFVYNPDTPNIYKALGSSTALPNIPWLFQKQYTMAYNQKFDQNDWYKLHLLNLALRVQREQQSFFLWNKDPWKTASGILMVNSVLEDNNAFIDAFSIVGLGYKTMMDDPTAYYQQAAGPYIWQEKGQNKIKNLIMKNLGFTAENFSPANAIEKSFGASALNK